MSDRNSHAPRLHCSAHCVPNVLTAAGHGGRVRLGAKVSLVAHAGGGSLPDGVAVQRTLGAGAVGGQGTVVADLTGWREGEKKRQREGRLGVNVTGSSGRVKDSHLCTGGKTCLGISSEIYQANKVCAEMLYSLPSVMS